MREERKFLECNLSGRNLMWPVWGMLAIVIAISVIRELFGCADCEGTPFFPNFLILNVVTPFVAIYLLSMLVFSLTKRSVEACGFKGERAEADYVFGIYYKRLLLGALLCVISCGLYLPWFVADLTKSLVGGISYKGVKFDFHGTGVDLLSILVLGLILPFVVLVVVLGVVTAGGIFAESVVANIVGMVMIMAASIAIYSLSYALLARWMLRLSYGDKVIKSNFSLLGAILYIVEQWAFTIFTLGLYAPMMSLRIMKYFVSEITCGEGRDCVRLGMRLRSWRDWAYVWGQMLLVVVTLGIYTPWCYARLMNRFVPRIYIDPEA